MSPEVVSQLVCHDTMQMPSPTPFHHHIKHTDLWSTSQSSSFRESLTKLLCLDAQAQVDMADAALWLYGIAFQELQRHIAVECRERAQVLACLWEHSTCLTELRCAVQYESLLAQSRQGFESLADQRTYLKGQIRYKMGAWCLKCVQQTGDSDASVSVAQQQVRA